MVGGRTPLIALIALLGVARTAAAFGTIPLPLLNNDGPIPGDGGVLLWAPIGEQPVVEVRAATTPPGPLIAGSLRAIDETRWVWMADATLPEGLYSVIVHNGTYEPPLEERFGVTGVREPHKPALTSAPEIAITQTSENACCWTLANNVRMDTACFPIARHDQIELRAHIATTEPSSALTQLLFAIEPSIAEPELLADDVPPAVFAMQADEYCFDLTAIEITTGERYTFDELTRCVPHGELPPLQTGPVEEPTFALQAEQCAAPPVGYEARWCELNKGDCTEHGDQPRCALFSSVCGDGGPPGMTTGGAAGNADPPPNAGTGESMADAAASDREASPADGCSVKPTRANQTSRALALLCAGLALARAGARARRRRQ